MNANRVPTLTISSSLLIGKNDATTAIDAPDQRLDPHRGTERLVRANDRGSRPSLDIANSTRD